MNPEIGSFEQNGHDPQEEAYLLGKLFALTDSEATQEYLLPQLAEFGVQNLPTEELVRSVVSAVSVYGEDHMNGMVVLALNHVPEYIEVLVQDPEEKKDAMRFWYNFVEEFKESSAQAQADLPRTLKKALKKPSSDRRPGEKAKVDRYRRRSN